MRRERFRIFREFMPVHPARRALLAVAVALTVGALGACTEKLDSGAACPALCPGQSVPVRDTMLDAVVVDTSILGYPAKGDESFLIVADRGADLQTSAVVRFDTLSTKYNKPLPDTGLAITEVHDSKLRLIVDSLGSRIPASLTLNVYDVNTTAPDDDDAAVLALFTSSRLIGSATFTAAQAKDTLFVPLSDSAVLNKIVNKQRLRVGIRVTSSAPVQLKINSTAGGVLAPVLSYDPTVTTDSVAAIIVSPRSATPVGLPTIASSLRDYTIYTTGPRSLGSDALSVGGLPARRTYLRFDVPKGLLDSTTIVRAALLLTQRPNASPDADTVIKIIPAAVLAGTDLNDIARSANVLAADSTFGVTTIAYAPKDSGLRVIELGLLLRSWRTIAGRVPTQHAIVLRSGREGQSAGEVRFFSTNAPADTLRPRLRVTYVPRVDFGVP